MGTLEKALGAAALASVTAAAPACCEYSDETVTAKATETQESLMVACARDMNEARNLMDGHGLQTNPELAQELTHAFNQVHCDCLEYDDLPTDIVFNIRALKQELETRIDQLDPCLALRGADVSKIAGIERASNVTAADCGITVFTVPLHPIGEDSEEAEAIRRSHMPK
ncbi:MAG: hypothetical protein UY05_C0009G0013 [Candidatus Peregrinibacteria bacterium GW2011_GWA2_47_7]|nr:MAG: hypothetical protein UY05_C0009G0013 [Candidatus Peregrinibacteria bacterium GW2011_GWA2_47_7]